MSFGEEIKILKLQIPRLGRTERIVIDQTKLECLRVTNIVIVRLKRPSFDCPMTSHQMARTILWENFLVQNNKQLFWGVVHFISGSHSLTPSPYSLSLSSISRSSSLYVCLFLSPSLYLSHLSRLNIFLFLSSSLSSLISFISLSHFSLPFFISSLSLSLSLSFSLLSSVFSSLLLLCLSLSLFSLSLFFSLISFISLSSYPLFPAYSILWKIRLHNFTFTKCFSSYLLLLLLLLLLLFTCKWPLTYKDQSGDLSIRCDSSASQKGDKLISFYPPRYIFRNTYLPTLVSKI